MMYDILSQIVTLITSDAVSPIMDCTTNQLLRIDVGKHKGVSVNVQ